MTSTIFLAFLTCSTVLLPATGLKILINQPTLSLSHMQFHGILADALIDAGHEVHVFLAKWNPRNNATGTDRAAKYHTIASNHPNDMQNLVWYVNPFESPDPRGVNSQVVFAVNNVSSQLCLETFRDMQLMEQLVSEKFDVGVTQGMEYCAYSLFHRLGIKTFIGTSALPLADHTSDNLGIPSPRSYVPIVLATLSSTPFYSYLDRVKNICFDLWSTFYVFPRVDSQLDNAVRSVVGEAFPASRDLAKKASYIFVNTHPHFDHQRPKSNKIIHIGGIGMKQHKNSSFSPQIGRILRQSKKGVILFSFGSVINPLQMPLAMKAAFFGAFRQFPEYDVIFRHPGPVMNLTLPKNVHTVDWAPQVALLHHPATKAFITHGGLNSVNEAAFAGVPLLVIPFFADQYGNGALVRNRGIGVEVFRHEISAQTLSQKLNLVLTDSTFTKNAMYLSQKLKHYPYNPREQFVSLVEYAAVYGDRGELDLPAAHLDVVTLHNLDIVLPLLFIFNLLVFYLIKRIISAAKKIARSAIKNCFKMKTE